jgi:uncharacterized phage-associated protein
MSIGMAAKIDLIGNLIVYIADYCKKNSNPLYQTKLLKLLYLIDEESVIQNGTPITWLDYAVWQKGPVPTDVYFSKLSQSNAFEKFVSFENRSNRYLVVKKREFENSNFSEIDLGIIGSILTKYGKLTSEELITITHKEGSLWSNIVEEKNIKFSQNNHTSNVCIDFSKLIAGDKFKQFNYWAARECLETNLSL